MTARRIWLTIDIGLKLALIGLLLMAVLFPHLPQFEGKAMGGRALAYPLSVVLVPAVWFLWFRRYPYPIAIDILIVLPFLIDTAGNALDLYDTIEWWDDANHLVELGDPHSRRGGRPLLPATGATEPIRPGSWIRCRDGHRLGAGGVHTTFIRNSPELATAYTDTLGDLALGTIGAIIGSAVVAWLLPIRAAS